MALPAALIKRSMMSSENRFTLFGTMLQSAGSPTHT